MVDWRSYFSMRGVCRDNVSADVKRQTLARFIMIAQARAMRRCAGNTKAKPRCSARRTRAVPAGSWRKPWPVSMMPGRLVSPASNWNSPIGILRPKAVDLDSLAYLADSAQRMLPQARGERRRVQT